MTITAADVASMTPERIAALLPPSWVYSFVSLDAALNYYYPEGLPK